MAERSKALRSGRSLPWRRGFESHFWQQRIIFFGPFLFVSNEQVGLNSWRNDYWLINTLFFNQRFFYQHFLMLRIYIWRMCFALNIKLNLFGSMYVLCVKSFSRVCLFATP